MFSMTTDVRELSPKSPPEVVLLLQKALDLALDGDVRGVVVMLDLGPKGGAHHYTAGDLNLGRLLVLLERWKFLQLSQHTDQGAAPLR